MRKRNLLSLVLTLMLALSCFASLAFSDNSKEQLSINFVTDKEDYKQGEDINIEINIKNISGKDLKEIEVKNILPEGIEVKSSENGEKIDKNTVKWTLNSLKSNESVNLKLQSNLLKYETVVPTPDVGDNNQTPNTNTEIEVPNTGMDYFNYLLVGSIILLISISGITYIRKNSSKLDKNKVTSIGMAIIMSCGILGESLIIADASQSLNNLNINKIFKITCDGEELENAVEVKGVFVNDVETSKPIDPEQPEDSEEIETPNDDLLNPDNPKWSIDSDKDGLVDAEEELLGTNANNTDTDNDGLNDKFEVESGLDSTKKDSDDNGILDSEEDLDNDRLKNIDEQKHNTSAIIEDSDVDGLSDYEEINKYNTNPLQEDTDEDGVNDGKEVELGTNPNKKDSDRNGINDGDEKYEVDIETPKSDKGENIDVTISGNITGKNIDDLYIINMEGAHEFISSDIPGYIAPPFRIGNNGDCTENVDITFTLDPQVIKNNSGDELAVYKYNSENQTLDIVSESIKLDYSRERLSEMEILNILLQENPLGVEYYEYIEIGRAHV